MSTESIKTPKESYTLMTQLIFPTDTNHYDTMFGGRLLEYMDKAAAISAMRHARSRTVTASMDSIDFLAPIHVGDVIEVTSFVTWTHRSSMEIYVSVVSEKINTGERINNVTAFFTFVALDAEGKPTSVPSIQPESEFEKQLFEQAPERHELRKKRKAARKASLPNFN